jgi:hypothetical protein
MIPSLWGCLWRLVLPRGVKVASSSDDGRVFSVAAATSTVHSGVLCTQGDGCSIANSRDLYDDFGAAINPRTGALSVARIHLRSS